MTLTPQQQQVLNKVKAFLDSDIPVFILKGYAGTGKTTMIRTIIEEVRNREKRPLLMAPTGRAARVLETKNSWNASTIHRCIYELDTIEITRHLPSGNCLTFAVTVWPSCRLWDFLMPSGTK